MTIYSLLCTDSYSDISSISLTTNSLYLYSTSPEDRCELKKKFIDAHSATEFVYVDENGDFIHFQHSAEIQKSFPRTAWKSIAKWLHQYHRQTIYIDITGMQHGLWAPLLRAAIESGLDVHSVYTEPKTYIPKGRPIDDAIFDLSEYISGVAPLPGFINFRASSAESIYFIAMLGFEGARFGYVLSQLDTGVPVIPVVGVPGYQPEYPFYTYVGNKHYLLQDNIWKKIQTIPAYCPFGAYDLLRRFHSKHPSSFLKIAPIGTKPHGLGAILYAIKNHARCEIVYDNPLRKSGRTSGSSRTHIYNITQYLKHNA